MKHKYRISSILLASASCMFLFQNCDGTLGYSQLPSDQSLGSSTSSSVSPVVTGGGATDNPPGTTGVCSGVSCSLDPLTTKAAVTTILLALGDEANNQLVINGGSSQLVAETVVRYSTPVTNPKILVVSDWNNNGESPEDLSYVSDTLLQRYDVTVINEPAAGLAASDLVGYDLVWFNNPGYPMGSSNSRDALIAFTGGVVLQGDDLSQGNGFSISALTGLTNVDNGTQITCGSNTYNIDDNVGNASYVVNLDGALFTGSASSMLQFNYGNDLDNTVPARADLEVLATAKGSPTDCTATRPAIVRYLKQ